MGFSRFILGVLISPLMGSLSSLVDLVQKIEPGGDLKLSWILLLAKALDPHCLGLHNCKIFPGRWGGWLQFPSGCVLVFPGLTPPLSVSLQARGPVLQGSHWTLPELQLPPVRRAQCAPAVPGLADRGGPEQLLHLDGEEASRPRWAMPPRSEIVQKSLPPGWAWRWDRLYREPGILSRNSTASVTLGTCPEDDAGHWSHAGGKGQSERIQDV